MASSSSSSHTDFGDCGSCLLTLHLVLHSAGISVSAGIYCRYNTLVIGSICFQYNNSVFLNSFRSIGVSKYIELYLGFHCKNCTAYQSVSEPN